MGKFVQTYWIWMLLAIGIVFMIRLRARAGHQSRIGGSETADWTDRYNKGCSGGYGTVWGPSGHQHRQGSELPVGARQARPAAGSVPPETAAVPSSAHEHHRDC